MKTTTIIWDFDGTLLPLTPYDSEQALMRFKLDDIDSRPPWIIRAVARLLILADRRQMLRKTFKQFYIQSRLGMVIPTSLCWIGLKNRSWWTETAIKEPSTNTRITGLFLLLLKL